MAQQSRLSIALAIEAATGHVNAGLELYRAFAAPRPPADPKDTFARAVQLGVPAITNLALGLELLLKAHHFQAEEIYPRGHDIAALGLKFSADHLNILRRNYSQLHDSPTMDKGLEFRISTQPPGSAWEQPSIATYDLAIAYIGRAYERWRYIYEEFSENMDLSFMFAPLYFSATAVHKAVVEFKGNTKIQAAVSPPNKSLEQTRDG